MSRPTRISESFVVSKIIPVKRTEDTSFDDSFAFMKEKFHAEMAKVEEAMNKFSEDLMVFYGQEVAGNAPLTRPADSPAWKSLIKSPLVHGKNLKLQFDMSEYDPGDINVQIDKDVLNVTANLHEESDHTAVFKEFKRQFILPKGVDPSTVQSSFTRDGVLIVEIALPKMMLGDYLEEEPVQGPLPKPEPLRKPEPLQAKPLTKPPSKVASKIPSKSTSKTAAQPVKSMASPDEHKGVLPHPARQRPQSPMSSVSPAAPHSLPKTTSHPTKQVLKTESKPKKT